MLNFITPFRVVIGFLTLAIISILLLPQLEVDLLPAAESQDLTVSFSLPDSSPDVVEQQATSLLEGAFSQISQLNTISSVSGYNGGFIQLKFDRSADLQYKQFEVVSIIRQLYPALPLTCSYPEVIPGSRENKEKEPILVYSINGPIQPYKIKEELSALVYREFASERDIREINISGANELQISISFDKNKCNAWHIDPLAIHTALQTCFHASYPGTMTTSKGEEYFIVLESPVVSQAALQNIPLSNADGTIIHLGDVATVTEQEQEATGYFRVNGKNSVSLALYARSDENQLALGERAKKTMERIAKQLPYGFDVKLESDETEFLRDELSKNYRRAGLSVLILVAFILFAYRSVRHLLNLLLSLAISLCLTILLVWLLGIGIHLYTIAGLAISFGIMMDNAIVMLDHYRQWRDRQIFMALLASSVMIICAVGMVFFLPPAERKNLTDFSIIIILALISSLLTSLLFIPGFFELLHRRPAHNEGVLLLPVADRYSTGNLYYTLINFFARFRKTCLLLVVIAFGLPLFMLPNSWEGEHWYNRWYNQIIGSTRYQQYVKPKADTYLGGAFRLFVNNVYEKGGYRPQEKTRLYIKASLPYGNTVTQLDSILVDFERYLASVDGVAEYVTNISSGQQGAIEVSFKKEAESTALPLLLKSKLIQRSLDWNGVDWDVFGVGQGFSNSTGGQLANFRVIMKGYNYDELGHQVNKLVTLLSGIRRVDKINPNEILGNGEKAAAAFSLELVPQQMSMYNTSNASLVKQLTALSDNNDPVMQISFKNQYYPVVVREKNAAQFSGYQLMQDYIARDTTGAIKISSLGKLQLSGSNASIYREDRQYVRVVGFEFMGSQKMGKRTLDEALNELNEQLPVGYTAIHEQNTADWGKSKNRPVLILALLLSVFIICSILFENLRKPFFIILMIPVSFIGLFLIFSTTGYYFDQGGYAAFIMLGGLVSNAAVFIVNDLNNLVKHDPTQASYNQLIIKAVAHRSRTILLTTISTCCGMIPFLLEGQNDVFWFSLALGTVGGLLFSLFALFVLLPVLLWRKAKPAQKSAAAI